MMRASAHVVAEADGSGGSRLTTLYGEPPLLVRRTGPAEVHLVGGAAGPLGGDELRIDVEVGPGASLTVRGVAASVLLPGSDGARSRFAVRARVAAGARLVWLPEPLIATRRCRHTSEVLVLLEEGGALVWREELVCGRFGERPGDVRVLTSVGYGALPLYRNELAVGPDAPGWDGPAVLGGAGAVGSLLVVDPLWAAAGPVPGPEPEVLGPTAAVLPLAGPGVLVSTSGPDALAVRADLDTAYERLSARGRQPRVSTGPGKS
jgi:urease accessory protein